MATQRERIGFIGLGSMGQPMATSLVRKGFALSVFDTAATHTAVLVERGATRAGDLAVEQLPCGLGRHAGRCAQRRRADFQLGVVARVDDGGLIAPNEHIRRHIAERHL